MSRLRVGVAVAILATVTILNAGPAFAQQVDEKFTSSDKTFDPVKDPTDIEFPAKVPTNGQLGTSVDRLNQRATSALSAGNNAKDSADTATTLAIVGIVVGVLLGGTGLLVGLTARKSSA